MGADAATGRRLVADAVVTVDEAMRVLRPGAVDLDGDRIGWVGRPDDPDAPPAPGPVEAVGGLLMPGLVNCHAHSPMTLLRGAGDGLPLDRWLREAVWPREARMDDEDAYWGMLAGASEMLANGVTTSCEHYRFPGAVARAALDAGLRTVLTPAVIDLPGPHGWRDMLDAACEAHADWDGRDGLLSVGFGPHGAYTMPGEGLAAVAEAARQVGALVQIHLCETTAEDAEVRARHGCGAPEVLARTGLLEGRVLCAHAVWLDDGEIALLAGAGAAVAHCPQSNGKLGSGVARLQDLRAAGITVGLGTDGPASNDDLDLWDELRLAPVLARATAADAGALGTSEALVMGTRDGAAALGLHTGCLAAGRAADVVRLELDDLRFLPGLDDTELVAHLVWSAASRLVTDVWVGGRQVVADGRCVTVDRVRVAEEVRRRAGRLAAGAALPEG